VSNEGYLDSDEQLMRRYQQGDEQAFNELFSRYSPRVFGFLQKRVGNHEDLHDLFQNVFTKLHRSRPLFKDGLPFAPWMYTITKTALLDYQRKASRELRPGHSMETSPPRESDEAAFSSRAIDLQGLASPGRTALELRYYEDLSFEEIAKQLGTTPTNARQMVSRALKRLRKLLIIKERAADEDT
jgi:RNA polymerase sigma factor (sigma-70 family)